MEVRHGSLVHQTVRHSQSWSKVIKSYTTGLLESTCEHGEHNLAIIRCTEWRALSFKKMKNQNSWIGRGKDASTHPGWHTGYHCVLSVSNTNACSLKHVLKCFVYKDQTASLSGKSITQLFFSTSWWGRGYVYLAMCHILLHEPHCKVAWKVTSTLA